MIAATIRYDGVDWPVETFIDAYRFTRRAELHGIDRVLAAPYRAMAVLCDGTLIRDAALCDLPYRDVIALRPIDCSGLTFCDSCGILHDPDTDGFPVAGGHWCEDCWDEAEPE